MKNLVTLLLLCLAINVNGDSWVQKASFPGKRTYPFCFSIGNKGYVGCGKDTVNFFPNDFWEYDPSTNAWTQKANFGGGGRHLATGFSIGNKGYAGLGVDATSLFQDFWEYDPANNIWIQKANFGGGIRWIPVGFSIGNLGYIGYGLSSSGHQNDLWAYDPALDLWSQKGSTPILTTGWNISCFVVGSNAYLALNNIWEYNSINDAWTQKAVFPQYSNNAAAFSICNKGYIGTGSGNNNNWWQYDPVNDTFTQKTNFLGVGRERSAFFSIGDKGYVGLGKGGTFYNDFYEYTPDSPCATGITDLASSLSNFTIYPNPAREEFKVSGLKFKVDNSIAIKVFVRQQT